MFQPTAMGSSTPFQPVPPPPAPPAAVTSMYSQQQQHHHHHQFQYQQQPQVQGGLTWNGSAWVSAGNAAAKSQYSNYSTYNQAQAPPPQPQPQIQPAHPPPPSNPAPSFNQEAYRYYYNQGVQYRGEAAKPGVSDAEKKEALRKAAWADYYASQVYHGQTVPPQHHQPASNPNSPAKPPLSAAASTKGGALPQDDPVSPSSHTPAATSTATATAPSTTTHEMKSPHSQLAGPNTSFSAACSSLVSSPSSSASPPLQPATKKKKSRFGPPLSPSEKAKKHKFGTGTEYYQPNPPSAASTTFVFSNSSSSGQEEDYIPLQAPRKQQVDKTNGLDLSATALAARAHRFSGKGGLSQTTTNKKKTSKAGKKKGSSTTDTFGQYMGLEVIGGNSSSTTDFESMTVKGTCSILEKEYLRLTAPPKAELVRPQPILEKHFSNLKKMYSRCERDYTWFCSQFKAIRQDLTVQRVENEFTVDIYETHARIALEEEDLNEYNQCQTQLKELYGVIMRLEEGVGRRKGLANMREFIAYRIIYYVFLTLNKKYEGGSSDLLNIMLSLTPEDKKDECIAHALKVRVAVADYDYHSFFNLHQCAPKMSPYLMDYMVPSIRLSALQRIAKAYRPSVEVAFALKEIGFEACEAEDGKAFLQSCGAKLDEEGSLFITKDSVIQASVPEKKNSLI